MTLESLLNNQVGERRLLKMRFARALGFESVKLFAEPSAKSDAE